MKKLTLFFVAIFAMVNVANAQRAWAYDLELTPSVDSYTFAFKAVTAGDATLVFYKDGIEAATLDLGSVSAGDNTVTKTSEELLGAIQQSGDFTWGVKMSAGAIALSGTYLTELTAAGQGLDFYLPQGLVVDNNPESETFSSLFIAEAQGGKLSVGPTHTQGIYHYSQTLAELNTTDKGIIPSNVTLTNGSRQEMHRIAINPKNNHVAFAHNVSGKAAVWSVPANNPAGEATNLIAGTEITMPNSICFDENGVLYVMDNANTTNGGTLYRVVDGVATKLVQNKTWQQVDNSLAYDGRGGIWIAQTSTGTTWPSYAILSHVNSSGEIDWSALDHSSDGLFSAGNSYGYSQRGQCAYNTKEDLLVLGGNCRSHIFQVTYNAAGNPSLTLKYRTPFIKASTNIDGAAFDYAGDLYLMSAARERLYKYVVPTNNNTCTVPAKKSQVITLVSATPEYNVTINVNGNGTVTGANTGTYLEGTELSLTATPAEHYEFTGWTGDVNSTENPLTITVDGNKNITANFAKKQYTLTVLTNDENKGTVTGAGTYDYGMVVTIEAIAQPGYKLLYWSDRSKESTRTITMNKNEALLAYFVKDEEESTFTIQKVWENAQVPTATADGYQAVGWDGKIYMQNKTAGTIQVFSNGTDAAVDYATSGTGQQIAVDEAGNLIVFNAYFATSTPNSVLIYKKGDATGTAVSFTLQDPARCDFFSASGDIYSAEGGYVYFYCAGKTVINRLKITNGAATETDVMTDVVGESVYSSPQNTNYVMVDIFGNLVAHARSNAINAINVYTNETKSFALPSIKMGTLGGCSFELGGKELWAYHAGATNYSSEWNIYNMTDSKFLSDTVLYAIDKTNSSNNACNWLNVQVIDENTAYIYQFCPKKAAAVWKVTRDVSYTVSATATNGTVSGTGVYKAGTTATLTATPNTGYKFINWTKGEDVVSTEATYSFTVSEDVALVANFEALPKTPRAWAYNLKRGEEGDNYTFTFTATAAGQATILFEDVEGNPIAPTYHEVGAIEAGEKTVVIAKSAFEGAKDVYWSVKMDGAPIEGVVEITDASKGIYNFYLPQGVVVDNNPESKTFGTIFVAESTDGASDGGSDRAKAQKRGIFVYDQTLAELNPTSNVGVIPSNVTLANTTRNALKRIAINPKTNEVAFAYNASPAAVWAVSTENVAGEATNLLAGLEFDYCNSLCFDENGTLYIFDNGAGYPAKGSLYKIVNGEKHTIFSENAKYGNADNSLVSDGRGGLWIAQNRSKLDGFNQLAHVSASGVIDFEVNSTTTNGFASLETSRGAMAYNPRENILAIGIGASGTIGVSLYQVTYNPSTGVPSLEYIGATPSLGKNVDGIAFDYAGDLYALSANAERFYKFTLPTNENTCTVPAPSSQKLVLGTQCEVTVTINDPAMGSVEGAGQHEKGAEVTLTAKPVAHHRFVNWTGDKTSTDNPFKFTIEGNVALTANFEATPQWTITVTANDDSMGTVSGSGTYDEGAEVTITATPNATYRFVKWSDDVTDATRTFSAAENLTLQAIFEKVPNRAWAYDLSQVADGDNYKFSFVATTAGEATLLFADKDGNELVAPYAVGTVAAGANTVTLAKTTFEGVTKDVYWSVKMDGEEITAVAEITDQSKGIYDFYSMRGVVVDNDPNSTDFGKIYVEMSLNGASDGASERTKTQTAGIFIYDQQLNELNTPSNKGYKPTMPSGYTELGTAADAMKRLAIDPSSGNLVFGNNIADEGSVWSIGRDNLTGTATNIIEGATGINKVNAICYDEKGSLYVLANITLGSSKYNLYKFTDGVQTELTLGGEKIFVDAEVAMASDGRGGIWIAQNRSGISQYKILSHVNVAEDKLDFVVETEKDYSDWFGGNCYRAAVAYNPNTNVLAVQGINKVSLFSVSYDASGVPSITKLVQTPTVGKNIDGLAFDYAGDLYVVNSSAEKLFKFTIPTTDNICTVPAPASQKLVLGTQCEVTVNVNDPAMGSVEGAGQHEKDATVTLKATANEHYQFVNWTKGAEVLSAENPYSFIVTEDVTITANFAELPKYTITVNVNDNTMGSVTGGGTVYVGESVTLTATPNSGYAFVKWDDGITEATRTVLVEGDKTYTAIFQAMIPRAWAYDLRIVEDGDNYKFTFKATSTGTATLLFTNKAGTPVAPTSYAVGNVEAGEKSVTIAKSEFGGTEDIYWSVQMDGAAIENMVELTDPTKGIYDIVAPQGIAVDNNTDSKHFGQVYVAAATDGTVSRGAQTRGIFVYDPILNELNSPNAGYLPANATLTSNTRQAIHRVAVNPTNNQVAFAYNISGSSAIWSMNPENLAGDAVDLIEGAGITKANSLCFDESGALYVMDNANTSTGGNIYKIKDGEANVFAVAQTGYHWGVEENAMTPDGRGGLWIAQNRWQVDGYPVLSHVDKNGNVDFAVTSSSPEALKALFPHDDNNASYRGQCAYYVAEDILAFGGNKEAVLFKVTYDANNVPTNLEKIISTGKLGTNIDGVAFDYAGDLYVASENTKRFYKFVVPTNNNTCTVPAPKSQVIQKETRYIVTVVANPAEGGIVSVSDDGNAVEGATLEVTATANTGYRFVNWTKDAEEVSASASFDYTVPAEDVTLTANFEPLPEITYELNGGVWNKYGWTSKKDMYNALLDDWRAYSGSTRTNVTYETQLGIGNSSKGIPTTIYYTEDRLALQALFTDATYAPKWGWLATYVDAVAVAQSKATQPTTAAGNLVYALGNFFGEDNVNSTNWMGAVDFTGEEAHLTAFAPYWGQTFPMPTQPTEEVILNAPYKEGYLFEGWYATSNFSGEEVTVVDENANGTLYAKWLEHFYTRDVTNGDFGTICLPYGSSSMTGAEFYEVVGKETGKVYLDQVTKLEAGIPYIFRANANTIKVIYEGKEPKEAYYYNGLYGTFNDNTPVEAGNYIVFNNELRLCGTECYINAYRAYLKLADVSSGVPAPMPGRQRVGMNVQGGNETTALDNITEGNGTITPTMEGTYDVLGRKLTQPTNTGVYIINGKKVFVVK